MANDKLGKYKAEITADTTQYRKEIGAASKETDKFKQASGALGAAAATITGPFGGVSSRISSFTSLVSTSNFAVAGLATGVAALTTVTIGSISKIAEMERGLFKTEAVLRATGNASGLTAQQLDQLARQTALNTLASTSGMRDAINVLLTFKSVSGDVFKDTIGLTQDMAAVFGGDATRAAVQLGKALEDPVEGINALKRVGVSYTAQQREQIKVMIEAGRQADAQRLVLKVLKDQIGGSGAAEAQGVSGAVDTLGQRWDELLESWGKTTHSASVAVSGINLISNAIKNLNNLIDPEDHRKLDSLMADRLALESRIDAISAKMARFGKNNRDLWQIGRLKDQLKPIYEEIKAIQDKRIAEIKKENEAVASSDEQAAERRAEQIAEQDAQRLKKLKELTSKEYAVIRNSVLDKSKLENEQHQKRLETLAKMKEFEPAKQKEIDDLILLERQRHVDEILRIEKDSGDKLLQTLRAKASSVMTSLQTAQQKERENHLQRVATLEELWMREPARRESVNKYVEAEQARHVQAMAEIDAAENKKRLEDINKRMAERVATTSGLAQGVFSDINALKTEEEQENARYQARIDRFNEFARQNTELRGMMNEQIQREEDRHTRVMASIHESERQQRMGVMTGMLGNLSTLMNSHSKKAFKIGKAAAIANAVVSGIEAVVHSYKSGAQIGGPPLGAAFAATAAAATAVQIQNLKRQQFGGGATVTAGTSGGAAPGTYQPPQPAIPYGAASTPQQSAPQPVQIIFNGDVNGLNAQHLAETLKDHLDKTDFVLIDTNTRNGQLFAA